MAKKYKTEVKRSLVKEKTKLDAKVERLNNFIRGVDFPTLTGWHQQMLYKQANIMAQYSLILRDRIIDITSQEVE